MAWEEVTRGALEEGPGPRVPMPEETTRVLAQVEAVAADALSHTPGSHANEVKPWHKDLPGWGASAPGISRDLGSILHEDPE
jgi:hypothetical protein